jgi:hypothetical protein
VIGNGPAGFGRGVLEKDPRGHLASTLPRRSPTFFTAGIQRPRRHGRLGRGATMVPPRLISPIRSGD